MLTPLHVSDFLLCSAKVCVCVFLCVLYPAGFLSVMDLWNV